MKYWTHIRPSGEWSIVKGITEPYGPDNECYEEHKTFSKAKKFVLECLIETKEEYRFHIKHLRQFKSSNVIKAEGYQK